MTKWRAALRALWAEHPTLLGLAGALSVVIGVAQIYPPAAWIVAGAAAIATAWRIGQAEEEES